MIEAGVVIDASGMPLYWHLEDGRTAGSIPDSDTLWDVLWNNRENVIGFAHTHPGTGEQSPSYTDLTTFAAVEAGLGRRLLWWIVSRDGVTVAQHAGTASATDYHVRPVMLDPPWVERLRDYSYKETNSHGQPQPQPE